jgi:Ca2+-binding RTX toxin-like protein
MHATLLGGEGNDVLNAGVGADYIDGGGGDDTLEAIFGGTSTLHGGSGDDELVAYGRAFVYGDDGDDRLTIGPENVTIAEGGEGYDSVYVYDWQTDQITLRSAETPVQDAAEPLRPERSAAKPGTTTDVDVPTIVANQATVPPPFSTAAAPLAAGSVFGDHADYVWDALG